MNKELADLLFKDVDKMFREIKIDIAIKMVEVNMSLISIIGVELARGCKEEELSKRINWYNIAGKSMFIEENINEFSKRLYKLPDTIELPKQKIEKKYLIHSISILNTFLILTPIYLFFTPLINNNISSKL